MRTRIKRAIEKKITKKEKKIEKKEY